MPLFLHMQSFSTDEAKIIVKFSDINWHSRQVPTNEPPHEKTNNVVS